MKTSIKTIILICPRWFDQEQCFFVSFYLPRRMMRMEDAHRAFPLVFSPRIVANALAELDGVSLLERWWHSSQPRELLLSMCRDPRVDCAMRTWQKSLERIAAATNVPLTEVERQARLHSPILSARALLNASKSRPPRKMLKVVEQRCAKAKRAFEQYFTDSLVDQIDKGGQLLVERGYIQIALSDGDLVNAKVNAVPEKYGLVIERDLHYLQAPRRDSIAKFGMYLEGAQAPFCYLSFARSDRAYIRLALSRAIRRPVQDSEILILARAFGIGQLPRNTISTMVSESCKRLQEFEPRFVVTAVNPFLGFSGCSMFASGFVPFAMCPVAYNYSMRGEYVSRRQGGETRTAAWQPPPNVLFVRGTDRRSRRELSDIKLIYKVTDASHSETVMRKKIKNNKENTENTQLSRVRGKLYNHLRRTRNVMEKYAWCDETRYHGTRCDPEKPSKGQCGVTSFYLACHLREELAYHLREELDVKSALFCEGNVYFPEGTKPIEHHCWVRLPKISEDEPETDFIVDLTADQSGYGAKVIIDTFKNLEQAGINYKSSSEKLPEEVDVKHLRERLEVLQKNLSMNGV